MNAFGVRFFIPPIVSVHITEKIDILSDSVPLPVRVGVLGVSVGRSGGVQSVPGALSGTSRGGAGPSAGRRVARLHRVSCALFYVCQQSNSVCSIVTIFIILYINYLFPSFSCSSIY
jgi:hypothetical protein